MNSMQMDNDLSNAPSKVYFYNKGLRILFNRFPEGGTCTSRRPLVCVNIVLIIGGAACRALKPTLIRLTNPATAGRPSHHASYYKHNIITWPGTPWISTIARILAQTTSKEDVVHLSIAVYITYNNLVVIYGVFIWEPNGDFRYPQHVLFLRHDSHIQIIAIMDSIHGECLSALLLARRAFLLLVQVCIRRSPNVLGNELHTSKITHHSCRQHVPSQSRLVHSAPPCLS